MRRSGTVANPSRCCTWVPVLRERAVANEPGSTPVTRTEFGGGPSSSARSLTSMARPGLSPLLIVNCGRGLRTEMDSTKQIAAPSTSCCRACRLTSRANRTGARKAESNAWRQASSVVVIGVLRGGPPVLARAPSSRPKPDTAVSMASAVTAG
jgi:hypothetical protein